MKLGLALEGGANRTIFSAGVLDGLLDLGIMADHVTGVSAGIAYGVSYVSRQRGRNLAILENFVNDDRYMGSSHMLNPLNNCYFNLDFIYDEIPNQLLPYDYDTLAAHQGTVEAVVTDVNTGKGGLSACGPHRQKKHGDPGLLRPSHAVSLHRSGGHFLHGWRRDGPHSLPPGAGCRL